MPYDFTDISDLDGWAEYVSGVMAFTQNPDLLNSFDWQNAQSLTVGEYLDLLDAAEGYLAAFDWSIISSQIPIIRDTLVNLGVPTFEIDEVIGLLNDFVSGDTSLVTDGFDFIRDELGQYARDTSLADAMAGVGQPTGGATNGDDNLVGTAGSDSIYGRGGDDTIDGKNGSDGLFGEAGNDLLIGGGGSDRLVGGAGRDTLRGGQEFDALEGGAGNDRIFGDGGDDDLRGNSVNDRIVGGSGNDLVFGDTGNDVLRGGGGRDTIGGGEGDDRLTGNQGPDDFVFYDDFGDDTLTDFDAFGNAEDIDVSNISSIRNMRDLRNNHLTQDGDDAVIRDGQGNSITLLNVDVSDLGAGDFIF
jgi:Ca2+-binding RTX toxin-like protein